MNFKSALIICLSLMTVQTLHAEEQSKNLAPQIVETSNPSLEERYFKTREKSIHKSAQADDSRAINALETQLKAIIGPIKVDGFPGQGKINIEHLVYGEGGSDQVDGLQFRTEAGILFVTTEKLLNYYLRRHPEYPKELGKLTETGKFKNNANFYSAVLDWDAAVINFAEIPIKRSNGQSFARAYLGASTQDIGPIIPESLFVVVSKGDRIFLVSAAVKNKISAIDQCEGIWNQFAKKSEDSFDIYRASGLKDERALDEAHRYEEKGWAAYQECFWHEAVNQKFFAPTASQAQAIVDRLQ